MYIAYNGTVLAFTFHTQTLSSAGCKLLGVHRSRKIVPGGCELHRHYITKVHQIIEAFLQCIVHSRAFYRELMSERARGAKGNVCLP